MKYKSIVFDAYGTIFDVHSIQKTADTLFPGYGAEIAGLWRDKQIEYTRMVSMSDPSSNGSRHYDSFWNITRQALRYTLKKLKLPAGLVSETELMGRYSRLDPYPEVKNSLRVLKSQEISLAILSNANHEMLLSAVHAAGLSSLIQHLISADTVHHFKTHPSIYDQISKNLNNQIKEILFVSSNAWDVLSASWLGYDTFWINRRDDPLETIGPPPTYIGSKLDDVVNFIENE